MALVTDFVGDFRANTQYVTGDVNADGYDDLIEVWQDGGVFRSSSFFNNGQGVFSTGVRTDFVGSFRNNTQYLTGDLNRDGYDDLIEVWQDGGVFRSSSFFNNGQGVFSTGVRTDFVGSFRNNTQYVTGDVNADGYDDLIEVWQDGGVFRSSSFFNNGQGVFSTGVRTDFVGSFRNNTQYLTGDVNADGYDDLIEVWQDGGVFRSSSFFNNGQGVFSTGVRTDFVGSFRNNTQYLTGDLNRDGYDDLIEVWQDGGVFRSSSFFNNGQGVFSTGVRTDFVGSFRNNTQYVTGDVNRDGYTDLIEVWQDGGVFRSSSFFNNGQGVFV